MKKNIHTYIQIICVLVLCLASIPFLVRSNSRCLFSWQKSIIFVSRTELYFINRPELYQDYIKTAQIIQETSAQNIGLCMSEDDWEYPLWVLTNKASKKKIPTFRHILVENDSAKLQTPQPPPDLIVSTRNNISLYEVDSHSYACIFSGTQVKIWKLTGKK